MKNKKARVIDFEGSDSDWRTVEEFFRINKIELFDEDAEELYDDTDFY